MARQLRAVACTVALAAAAAACRSSEPSPDATAGAAGIPRGGTLTLSTRGEPRSFFRLTARDTTTALISDLTQAKLVRINKATDDVEPWLAESWTRSADGRRYRLKLRDGVVFSDGVPFTSDDVAFTFRAIYDETTGGTLADSLEANGKRLDVKAVDPHTVEIAFAEPFGPGVRLLDNLPIFPEHVLKPLLDAGRLASAWTVSTPPSEIVGLGPFVIASYTPGQRVVFTRNPKYFRKAPDGGPLPYVDRVSLEIIPDQNAELLRLESGQIDMTRTEIAPEAYAPLKRAADAGRVKLVDLGIGYTSNALWFNLKPGAFGADPRAKWLQRDELRQAISLAVDRRQVVDTVYLGAAAPNWGPVTEANRKWYWGGEPKGHDPDAARRLLASIGAGDGKARFTLLTQKGRPDLERGCAVIRDELKKVGVTVDVVGLEFSALADRFVKGNFEAVYFSFEMSDTDPAVNADFWLSSGSAHVWNPNQPKPATDWERQIDALMAQQIAASDPAERKRIFDDVQRIFFEHQPVVYFAVPRVYVAYSSRVVNIQPALSRPQLWWSLDTVAVR